MCLVKKIALPAFFSRMWWPKACFGPGRSSGKKHPSVPTDCLKSCATHSSTFAKRPTHRKQAAPQIIPPALSLLDLKLMLTAARLAHKPAAIILDEPDWGFSRQTAIAFVATVVKTAHAMGVAVLLISHKPWWRQVAPSTLRIEKEVLSHSEENLLFRIHLKAVTP